MLRRYNGELASDRFGTTTLVESCWANDRESVISGDIEYRAESAEVLTFWTSGIAQLKTQNY